MTLAIYIILGLLIAGLEFRRRSIGRPIDAMTAFNCYYLVLYSLVPINVLCLGDNVVRLKYAYEIFGAGNEYTALALLFSYVLFCLGYWLKSSNRSEAAIHGGRNYLLLSPSAYVAKVIFCLGILLTAIYVVQMGGIMEVIHRASEVRGGEFVIESKYIFYRHFSQFSADAFVLFCAVLIGKNVRKIKITVADRVFLVCALVFFVYYALSTGGRRPFIYPIILCFLVYTSVGGRLKPKFAVAALVLIFVFAGLGSLIGVVDPVANAPLLVEMTRDNDANRWALLETTYNNASQGLADSFMEFVGAQKVSLWQFGFLTDIVNLPRDFFPSQLFGFTRTRHMYGQVGEYLLGHAFYDDDPYGVPLGLHGYLLVNFGYVGMFALFFVLGLFYKWIHLRYKPAERKDAVGWLAYWWVVLAFFVYFREGVLLFVIKEQLTWWITIGLLLHYQASWRGSPRSSPAIGGCGSISTNQINQT